MRAVDLPQGLIYKRKMAFTLTPRRTFRGRLKSAYEELRIPLDVQEDSHFNLEISAKHSWPLISLETSAGITVRSEAAYNKGFAETGFFDADQHLTEDSLLAKVSMQSGHKGSFKLKLNNLGNLDNIQENVIRLTNKYRRKEGLRKLKADTQLSKAAQGHADDMDDVGRYLGHTSSDGKDFQARIDEAGYDWRSIRENVASGQQSAKAVVQGWMESPGHRANILSDDITEIGVGFAVDDSSGTTYWVQKFGAPV